MTPFAHPSDINWRNISNERRFIGVKRTALVFVSFIILVFVTTPTVRMVDKALVEMVSGQSDLKTIFYLKWFHKAPEAVRIFGESFLPPLVIICINQVLLYIIYILGSLN
jgi:hypothetical protein